MKVHCQAYWYNARTSKKELEEILISGNLNSKDSYLQSYGRGMMLKSHYQVAGGEKQRNKYVCVHKKTDIYKFED